MELTQLINHLQTTGETIAALLGDVSDEQARWKPDADTWSMLEVINHLADEEREDFRTRVDLSLHHPEQDWPPIHPGAWVTERAYNQRDLDESLRRFQTERQTSLDWLRSLQSPDWNVTHTRPQFGSSRAGDIMAAWIAHDLLHIRQLNELRYASLIIECAPYEVDYAGEW
ncbi:MAG: DinB family protein [Anaerolineae bacterium]